MANRVDNSEFFNGSPGNLRRPLEESSSRVELTGIDTVSDATLNLNNGLLHDVKLIPQKDINMVPGESPIYNNFHENTFLRLSKAFFR